MVRRVESHSVAYLGRGANSNFFELNTDFVVRLRILEALVAYTCAFKIYAVCILYLSSLVPANHFKAPPVLSPSACAAPRLKP